MSGFLLVRRHLRFQQLDDPGPPNFPEPTPFPFHSALVWLLVDREVLLLALPTAATFSTACGQSLTNHPTDTRMEKFGATAPGSHTGLSTATGPLAASEAP